MATWDHAYVINQHRHSNIIKSLQTPREHYLIPRQYMYLNTCTMHNGGILICNLTAFALPPTCMARSCSHVQLVSSCVDLIKVTWTPRERWTAEQSIHRNTPYVTLAHVGLLLPQSKHCWNKNISLLKSVRIQDLYSDCELSCEDPVYHPVLCK